MGACLCISASEVLVARAADVWREAIILKAQGKQLTESAVTYFDTFLGALQYVPLRSHDQNVLLKYKPMLLGCPESAQSLLEFLRRHRAIHLLERSLKRIQAEQYAMPPPYASSAI